MLAAADAYGRDAAVCLKNFVREAYEDIDPRAAADCLRAATILKKARSRK